MIVSYSASCVGTHVDSVVLVSEMDVKGFENPGHIDAEKNPKDPSGWLFRRIKLVSVELTQTE